MSTSCKVGYKNPEGSVVFTRINWDGYPDYVGRQLLKYWNSDEKAKQIATSKEIRSVSDCGLLEFYDDSCEHEIVNDIDTFINKCGNEDYGYIWYSDRWYILNKEESELVRLRTVIDKLDKNNNFDGPDLYDEDAKNLEA